MEGGEEIANKPRPRAKYTRAVHPYIPDRVSYLTLYGSTCRFIPNLIHVLLSTSCMESINMYMFRCSACDIGTVEYKLKQNQE